MSYDQSFDCQLIPCDDCPQTPYGYCQLIPCDDCPQTPYGYCQLIPCDLLWPGAGQDVGVLIRWMGAHHQGLRVHESVCVCICVCVWMYECMSVEYVVDVIPSQPIPVKLDLLASEQ